MNILLLREPASAAAVKGELFLDGRFFCFSLERPEVIIPAGLYPVKMRWSPRFQQDVPHIDNVPGRTAIEIHYGNFPQDTEGCVLVGYQEGEDMVGKSRAAFADLCKLLEEEDKPSDIQIQE